MLVPAVVCEAVGAIVATGFFAGTLVALKDTVGNDVPVGKDVPVG